MRIALVSDCYLPRLGGIEVQVHALATALQDAGHQVRVVTATPAGAAKDGMSSGGDGGDGGERGPTGPHRVDRLLPPVPLPVPVNPWAVPALREVLSGCDVVHVHLGVLAPFAGLATEVAIGSAIPTVLTWHSLPGSGPLARLAARRWRRWVASGALATAVSREAAAQVGTLLRGAPVSVLPNGLQVTSWVPRGTAPDPRVGSGRPVVITAIRFALRKRPLQVIRLMARARRGLPPGARPDLVIAGDGPWRGLLAALVRHTPWRSWVHLPGRLPRETLAERYRQADLYLAPSRKEAFGLASLEAHTAGLPVLGYRGTGLSDIVTDARTGILAGGDDDLVRQVRRLLADPGRLEQMTARVRAEPARHDWPEVVALTEQEYRRALGPTPAPTGHGG